MHAPETVVPTGVEVRTLASHGDERGEFTELFRDEWGTGVAPVQWNVVRSEPDVLRGVHCHPIHADALIVVAGRMLLGLSDLRARAPSVSGCLVELRGDAMQLVTIPPGVAHGFYFTEPSMHVYAVDRVWDPADELGCRWDDPGLGIEWRPAGEPSISARDAQLGSVDELRGALAARGI
jgi:dTDP-4-dehydrorhamnose 3,5-epimerase